MLTRQKPIYVFDFLSRLEKSEVVTLFNSGSADAVEAKARRITERYPAEVFGWNVLGLTFLRQGRNDKALTNLTKALALSPKEADIHNNCGVAFLKLDRLDEAAASFRRAVELRPDSAPMRNNLASALDAAGRQTEAAAAYQASLDIDPAQSRAHYNLGNILRDLGQLEAAASHYEKALATTPDHACAMTNLALTLAELERPAEAESLAGQALVIEPQRIEAHNLLASLALERDAPGEALPAILRSLALEERLETKSLFTRCIERLPIAALDEELTALLARALSEPWTRPNTLAGFAGRVLAADHAVQTWLSRAEALWPARLEIADLFGPAGLTANPLWESVLDAGPVCDVCLERFLTLLRRSLLETLEPACPKPIEPTPQALAFQAALARQCWINEYVFAVGDDETTRLDSLRQAVVDALADEADIPATWVVILAAYEPLYRLPGAERLSLRDWPEAVLGVITQQVVEPCQEHRLQAEIPELTAIRSEVSRDVRRQYEENPYPRWVKAAPEPTPVALEGVLQRRFPWAKPYVPASRNRLDVLVAGCGTGQHPLETARRYAGARVLAVDLSLASLGYARRKTEELGLTNVEYAQADILGLGSLGRRFDLIESSGVLHHLRDPFAGWEVLTGLLRPGAFMRIGLYSRLARAAITGVRTELHAQGAPVTVQAIRDKRSQIKAAKSPDLEMLTRMEDFFSVSGCRDLLFHVEEHCLDLPDIQSFLEAKGLDFLGFEIAPATLRRYRQNFPDDAPATNLANWHRFETDNPETFVEMYQFWLQKRP